MDFIKLGAKSLSASLPAGAPIHIADYGCSQVLLNKITALLLFDIVIFSN
jgi:hypothetical protein